MRALILPPGTINLGICEPGIGHKYSDHGCTLIKSEIHLEKHWIHLLIDGRVGLLRIEKLVTKKLKYIRDFHIC